MKKLLCLALALCCLVCVGCRPQPEEHEEDVAYKPMIYLYPETETEVRVHAAPNAGLTCSYPEMGSGWTVTAAPDGTLTDADGNHFAGLFWEGKLDTVWDLSRAWCVPGSETVPFLKEKLALLGLNEAEINEFIVFWMPRMQENPFNLVTFQTAEYTDAAPLDVTPAPDTLIRVFMVYHPLTDPVIVEAPELTTPERKGFTVVEWGGTCVGD